ncbi:hypothetical protein [Xaviernesmea oryzae]|uniref:hypothetical protein n=1 Tax=Xaviernesmea oryzae TaxID=464029 RepID=UPI0011145827|nr:hypothetical protein [Xaviernesmea oryzae]
MRHKKFILLLDRLKILVDSDAELRDVFLHHALNSSQRPHDPIAAKISGKAADSRDQGKIDHAGPVCPSSGDEHVNADMTPEGMCVAEVAPPVKRRGARPPEHL